jgi:hypothetical protein
LDGDPRSADETVLSKHPDWMSCCCWQVFLYYLVILIYASWAQRSKHRLASGVLLKKSNEFILLINKRQFHDTMTNLAWSSGAYYGATRTRAWESGYEYERLDMTLRLDRR